MPVPPLHRSLAVGLVVTATAAAAVAVLLPVARTPAADFAGLLVRGCALIALVAVAWLWAGALATIAAAMRGTGGRVRGVPAPVRRIVLTACGVALTGGLVAGPAHATPGQPLEGRTGGAGASVSGLPLPDRADSPVAPEPDAGPDAGPDAEPNAGPDVVSVAPGDSLWTIAARRHPGASDAEIDAAWRRIYALNRSEIGADPDLITPAQRLRMPISEVLP